MVRINGRLNGLIQMGRNFALSMEELIGSSPFDEEMEPTHRLNLVGYFCPVPVSELKNAITNLGQGSIVELICDDPETLHDIPMLIGRGRSELISVKEEAGEIRFLIEVKK